MSQSSLYKRKLYLIRSAATALSNKKSQGLLKEVREALNAPDEAFEAYCLPLIHHVAELVQHLPSQRATQFSYDGGMLDFLLTRCATTLRVLQEYLTSSHAADYVLADPDLWRYTLFSVVLLQHIGKLVSHYHIVLFDENKDSLGAFSCFSGDMSNFGTFYESTYHKQADQAERDTATLLLARQLMPTVGLNWIHTSKKAFYFWARTLIEDTIDQGGRWFLQPTQIITEALARILNRTLPSERLKEPKSQLFDERDAAVSEEKAEKKQKIASLIQDNLDDTHAAEAFLEEIAQDLDLRNYLEADLIERQTGNTRINTEQSPIHLIEKAGQPAWFIRQDVIKAWAEKNGVAVKQLLRQLFHLGVLANGQQQARLSIGPEATRTMNGAVIGNVIGKATLLGRLTALLTNVPNQSPFSATLKLHGNPALQQIQMINAGTWPASQPIAQNGPAPRR